MNLTGLVSWRRCLYKRLTLVMLLMKVLAWKKWHKNWCLLNWENERKWNWFVHSFNLFTINAFFWVNWLKTSFSVKHSDGRQVCFCMLFVKNLNCVIKYCVTCFHDWTMQTLLIKIYHILCTFFIQSTWLFWLILLLMLQLEHEKLDIQFTKRESVQLERRGSKVREGPEEVSKEPEEKDKYKRAAKPEEEDDDEAKRLAFQKAKVYNN